MKSKTERPPTEHRGSSLDPANEETIKEIEKRNSIAEVEEEESSEEDSSNEDEEVEEGATKKKVSATDKQEAKVTGAQKTQKQDAKDGDKAGVSVGD